MHANYRSWQIAIGFSTRFHCFKRHLIGNWGLTNQKEQRNYTGATELRNTNTTNIDTNSSKLHQVPALEIVLSSNRFSLILARALFLQT